MSVRILILFVMGAATVLVGACGGSVTDKGPASIMTPVSVQGNLEQVMLGIMYPAANIVSAAQDRDPQEIPLADDPVTTTDPLGSLYGGWRAVENAGIAIAESTNLMMTPGRKCTNGRDVPSQDLEWTKFVKELRQDAIAFYEAARTKDKEKMREAGTALDVVCDDCHTRYLETPTLDDRCK